MARANMASVSVQWIVEPLLEGSAYSSTCTLLTSRAHRVVVDSGLSLEERALVQALHRRGLEPGDIDTVINTHLHVDHCGNNAAFPRALFFMSRDEWRWTDAFYTALFASRTPEQAAPEFYPELASYGLKTRTIRNVARMARLFWRRERLGPEERFRWIETTALPEGLEAVPTPGHTPFHLSIRVAAPTPTIMAGDAVLAEDPEARVRTMIPHSRAQFLATREALLARGDRIVPGHGRAFTPLNSRDQFRPGAPLATTRG
jgi:glyoxylase-like metal-dependent hydrolase (beta-lactamase superfamily II)